jgi:hypothetical protein
MIINVTDEEKAKCLDFANRVVNTNIDKYRERNQTDVNKIIDDIYIGKLAEYATYKFLKQAGKDVKEPDIEVYGAKRKSFASDLTDGTLKYHVKCMKKSMADRFGLSWSFQIEDPLVHRPDAQDVIVLCEYDQDIEIKTLVKATRVKDIYTKPFLKKLHYIKKVLMWDDVYDLIKGVNATS